MGKRRPLSDGEKSLWEQETQGIKPLLHDRVNLSNPKLSLTRQVILQRRLSELYQSVGDPNPSLSMDTKLTRSRKVVVDGRIDLHGMTVNQAQEQLKKFLLHAQLQGREWLLVITGKGSQTHKSILRQEVPTWLDQWSLVTCYMVAKPQDGGNGAFYVRVRKSKL